LITVNFHLFIFIQVFITSSVVSFFLLLSLTMVSISSSSSTKKRVSAVPLLTLVRALLFLVALLVLLVYQSSDEDHVQTLAAVRAGHSSSHSEAQLLAGLPPPMNQVLVKQIKLDQDRLATLSETKKKKATIAYAWTLAKCSDFQSSTEGMIDAALVLRHSVHKVSLRSSYDYKMYVLVHPDAEPCTQILEDAGYNVKVLPNPIRVEDIRGEYLRKNVDREVGGSCPCCKSYIRVIFAHLISYCLTCNLFIQWCCGSKEFIKLYAYTLHEHPIVVHVDIDFAFYQPMDELFDAMLNDGADKTKIVTQCPVQLWPPKGIEAYITRDYQQLIPGDKRSLFQAGFMVVKPNQQVFDQLVEVILEGNFVEGWNATSGWGGFGYAGKVGAKAMQGLLAYYYDQVRPNVSVELHGCRYNWMGGDVFYRGVPTFYPRQYPHLVGKCRNGEGDKCEDCQKTPVTQIRSIHYTNCRYA
jgi:hypothetical protein